MSRVTVVITLMKSPLLLVRFVACAELVWP
jgi:hypothetical protein